MSIRKREFYSGNTEELIEFFENKYPLKSNRTFPRVPGEFYFYDVNDENSIRKQIENSKYPTAPLFFSRVVNNEDNTQTLHIEMDWFSKTDIK